MKTGLIDASSAILLYKANLFTAVSAAYRLKVAPAVLKEITVVKRKGASFFRRAFDTGSLFPAEPGPEPDASNLPALGEGERETLMAFRNDQGDFVIIDDGRGAAACRTDAIPYINALLCPKLLHWAGALDRGACDAAFNTILAVGRYSKQVVDYVETCTPDMLSGFAPFDLQHEMTRCHLPNLEAFIK